MAFRWSAGPLVYAAIGAGLMLWGGFLLFTGPHSAPFVLGAGAFCFVLAAVMAYDGDGT